MRSSSTQPLYWAALVMASAVTINAFELPLPSKQLSCEGYPKPDILAEEFPALTEDDINKLLEGVPNDAPKVYDETKDICEQQAEDEFNAECSKYRDEPQTCQTSGQWALTYNGGPSEFTQKVLKSLDEAGGIKATFFVSGSRVCEQAREMIKAINDGHEIGITGWSHLRFSTLSNAQIIAEIKWTEKAIMEVTGIQPKYIRPPHGNMDDRVRFIIKALGYTPVMWTVDTKDWAYKNVDINDATKVQESVDSIKDNVSKYIQKERYGNSETISLQSDLWEISSGAVRDVIDLAREAGWTEFVSMTKCLGDGSFAQNGPIVAGEPHGRITKLPVYPAKEASNPTDNATASKQPANVQESTSESVQAGAQESTATSFSSSLHGSTLAAAVAGLAFFALAM